MIVRGFARRVRWFALLLWLSRPASAQSVEAAAHDGPPSAQARPPLGSGEGEGEAKPWWKHIKGVPILLYTPETQFGFGAGMMASWQMPGAWEDRPSSIVAYGIYTTRKQTIAGATSELRFRDDRWVLFSDVRYVDWPDRFYGLGNETRARDRRDYTDRYAQAETELSLRVAARFYAGVRHQLRLSDSRDEDMTGVLAARPLGIGRLWWHGFGPVFSWDTRKGLFWPEDGSLLRADATFYPRWLGSDFSAVVLRADLRHYLPLIRDHVLAMRFVASGVVGDAPLQLLPALGGPLLFRGWYLGRLRDRVLGALELEYRVPLTPRWAVVGFGSLGRVASRVAEFTPRGIHLAGGAGARFAVEPKGRANVRLDLAYGDTFYVYLQFREAF